jgi:hypothetical protein
LRSDNGGEYGSDEFIDLCTTEGITREIKFPYNPKHNGVVKRKNRSIIGAARSMIHDQGLPFFLWVEAYNTKVYLHNQSPQREVGDMTLEEVFTRKKPLVEHLSIFRCITFSHVPKEKRTNMEPTAEKGLLVGYSETSKAYRLYIPTHKRLFVQRDVNFEEERACKRSRELEERQPLTSQQQGSQVHGVGTQSYSTGGTGVSGITGSLVVTI